MRVLSRGVLPSVLPKVRSQAPRLSVRPSGRSPSSHRRSPPSPRRAPPGGYVYGAVVVFTIVTTAGAAAGAAEVVAGRGPLEEGPRPLEGRREALEAPAFARPGHTTSVMPGQRTSPPNSSSSKAAHIANSRCSLCLSSVTSSASSSFSSRLGHASAAVGAAAAAGAVAAGAAARPEGASSKRPRVLG